MLKQDRRQALEWFLASDRQGDSVAQYNLGVKYMDGYGVCSDRGEAQRWLELAAKQGYTAAQCRLGWFYYGAEGPNQDLEQAAFWFGVASRHGDPFSLCALGVMAANGEGVPRDSVAAFAYLSLSGEAGYGEAMETRRQLEWTMTPHEVRHGQKLAESWKSERGIPSSRLRKIG